MTIIKRIRVKYLHLFRHLCTAVISLMLISCGNHGSHGTLSWTEDNQAIDTALRAQQTLQTQQQQEKQQTQQLQERQQPQEKQQTQETQQTQQIQQTQLADQVSHVSSHTVIQTPASKPVKSQNQPPTTKLNINQAAVNDLEQLPGIGPSKAKAIVDYRKKTGLFRAKEDIMKVKGIGPSIFGKISDKITVQ